MHKGIHIRLYPTDAQQAQMKRNFDGCRFVWNVLIAKQRAWYANGESYQNRISMNYLMKPLKEEHPFLKDVESTSLLNVSRHVDDAYQRFFNKQTKRPRFKAKATARKEYTMTMVRNQSTGGNIRVTGKRSIQLPKLGRVRARGLHRVTPNTIIKFATVSQESNGQYMLSLTVVHEPDTLTFTQQHVGIDLGVADLAIHSDGYKLANPSFEKRLAKKRNRWERIYARRRRLALARIQEARKQGQELTLLDCRNVQKAKQQVARLHAKTARQREDYLQKYTTNTVRRYDMIVLEDLRTKNLLKNRHLSRSIANAAWAKIKTMLTYKCEWYGKTLQLVNPAYTSQDCSVCHTRDGKKSLRIRTWTCKHCGTVHDRDINAAQNILYKGLQTP